MIIQYDIVVTIVNLIDNSTSTFTKTFNSEINKTDALLYNNYHVLSKDVYVLDMFEDEVNAYCQSLGIEKSSIEIDEFEIVSLTDRTDVFFESEDPSDTSLSLKPIIKCYVHPRNDALKVPNLVGIAYDSTTIIWSWPDDEQYAHYLIEEAIDPDTEADQSKIIAQLPIGATSYTETGLEPDTSYTRRLINYTDEQTSAPSPSVTVMTETIEISESLETYSVPKNYDFTTDDSEREIIEERLDAFHSGVGDNNDLKVYKQMDADFYQKFKAYFEITGRRVQREKRYDQVGFNYKICLEAIETVEEQEGEITFDVDAYPREEITISDYMWVTHPVTVNARMTATVFLRRELDDSELEEVKLYKPEYTSTVHEKDPQFIADPLGIVFVIDKTNSLDVLPNGESLATVKAAAISAINAITNKASVVNATVAFSVIEFGLGSNILCDFADAETAKAKINSIQTSGRMATATSWGNALKTATGVINGGSYSKYVTYFFSDGFPNTDSNLAIHTSGSAPKPSGARYGIATGNIIPDLTTCANGLKSVSEKVACIVCNYGGGDYIDPSSNVGYLRDYINNCQDLVATPGNIYHWGDGRTIEQCFNEFITAFTIPGDTYTTTQFDGWNEQPTDTSRIYDYSIDEVVAVTVTSEIFSFEFNDTVTPVHYSRKEKRAIISLNDFLPKTALSSKSVYDIIMDAVKQTSAWNAGFNKTIGTIETNGQQDAFLIKGLHIEDTYNFADEDLILGPDFGRNDWEDGMEGTVNTFTDIDKAGTTNYGDDCYLVSKNNYFYINGYTDGIIYDGTRLVTTELNYYDHPSEILISASGIYNNYLSNRKNDKLTPYPGSSPLNHVIDLIEIGKDIFLTRYTGLVNPGDWIEINPVTIDLVAHNETMYESPILNYRFNLEDPDARTPFYEILPTCDPFSEYLHVIIIHVYYAQNVWIMNDNNYVASFGTDPIATTSSLYIPLVEDIYQFTLKEWEHGVGKDNGKYIDEYLWVMAKPMTKTQDYYDELPGKNMDTFYGLVNGRYREDNQDGKLDLRVDCPQFNIPTTVDTNTIKIYIMITEFYPSTALISYKWEHPLNNRDDITNVNGDYVTFSSDSLTYKDVEYKDIITTINMDNQEVFDNKTHEQIYELIKPETIYEYTNYYLKVSTDNGDVLALRYPTEITFDENDKANVAVSFKGVVNATSQWAPRIHNGYYYLNQHEYFAYCEFDNIEANFEKIEEKQFKEARGYISIDVQLRHLAGAKEDYTITKDTRSELLQDETKFKWVDGEGLTLKPFISGEYYRKYTTYLYTSPVILFPNILTQADKLKVEYYFDDGSTLLQMEVRSYDVAEGKWSDWVSFTNDTIPNVPLSCGYQVRFYLQASTWETDLQIEDYMCCYLDWKDDMNEANTTNIVTITDHMMAGPDKADGIYISRIFDFGCETTISMDLFDSKYKKDCQLYVAVHDTNPDTLLLENAQWINFTYATNQTITGRYLRYKLVIPYGEKLYWLHKNILTKETHEILPHITGISMSGSYEPNDVVINFINTEAFTIPTDGIDHVIFDRILDIIGADVIERGFADNEIEYVKIQCTSPDITITYDSAVETQYPGVALNSNIIAKAPYDYVINIKNTPYIYLEKDEFGNEFVTIYGTTPQQYCPITVEDAHGNTYTRIYDNDIKWSCGLDCSCGCFMSCKEEYIIETPEKYIELQRNSYERETFKVMLNDVELTDDMYQLVNHLLIFNNNLIKGDIVTIIYMIPHSFYADIDRENNITKIYLYSDKVNHDIPIEGEVDISINGNTLLEMYNNGKRFSCYRTSMSMNVAPLEESAWSYDSILMTFITSANSGSFNGFVSTDICVDSYIHRATLKSDDADNDLNGVIVGYTYDNTGEPHTLSFVVTRDGHPLGSAAYGLVYDYSRPTEKILQSFPISATIDPSFSTSQGWNAFTNGIRLQVEKTKNIVTCIASMWDDPNTWNNNTLITFDLDSDTDTQIFSGEVYYGYCNESQAQSYYTDIYFKSSQIINNIKKCKVYYETSTRNNKFIASDLSMNPIYRTDYKGFIYLTDDHNEPYSVNIYCNPCRLKAGGYDKVDISIEVLDIIGNPVISKNIAVDCNYGILNCESYITDMNGVVHLIYESSFGPSEDILSVNVLNDNGEVIKQSITIINE